LRNLRWKYGFNRQAKQRSGGRGTGRGINPPPTGSG
jgi:hypothetical protein